MRKLFSVLPVACLILGFSAHVDAQSITIGTNQFASNYASGSGNDFGPMRTKGLSPASSRHA